MSTGIAKIKNLRMMRWLGNCVSSKAAIPSLGYLRRGISGLLGMLTSNHNWSLLLKRLPIFTYTFSTMKLHASQLHHHHHHQYFNMDSVCLCVMDGRHLVATRTLGMRLLVQGLLYNAYSGNESPNYSNGRHGHLYRGIATDLEWLRRRDRRH